MTSKSVYKLNTLGPKPKAMPQNLWLLVVLGLLLTSVLLPACGKKCQQVNQAFKYLSDSSWRLVETTDTAQEFRKLNNYTFPIFSFTLNFRGDVKAVINNEQFDSALCNMVYKPDSDGKLVAIQFTEGATSQPTQGADAGQQQTQPACPFSGSHLYEYKLGRNLELTDNKTGKYYRLVPFLGIIQPDAVCTF